MYFEHDESGGLFESPITIVGGQETSTITVFTPASQGTLLA